MSKINKTITLNESEQFIANYLAKSRYESNRKNNIVNAKKGPQSNYDTDLEGIASEMAFCKIFNLYPDFSIYCRSTEQDVGDVVLGNGKTVDIKSTKYKSGKLLVAKWKNKKVDYYALMVGTFPTYTFKGFMASEDIMKDSRVGNLGHGEAYLAEQSELYEI